MEASCYVDTVRRDAPLATSHAMFTLKVTSIEHASQELQQTTGNVVSLAGTVNTRFVYVALPLVQDAVGSFISWMRPAVRRVLELLVATYFQRQGYCPDVVTVGIAHGVTVTTPVVPEAIDFRRSEALRHLVHVHLEGHIRVLRTRDVEDRRVVHRRIRGRTVVVSTPWSAVHRGQRGVDRSDTVVTPWAQDVHLVPTCIRSVVQTVTVRVVDTELVGTVVRDTNGVYVQGRSSVVWRYVAYGPPCRPHHTGVDILDVPRILGTVDVGQ